MKRGKKRLTLAVAFICFLFSGWCFSYAVYLLEEPRTDYNPATASVTTRHYESYWNWLRGVVTVRRTSPDIDQINFDPSDLSPLEESLMQGDPQPVNSRPQ